jgi:hypothetical protein
VAQEAVQALNSKSVSVLRERHGLTREVIRAKNITSTVLWNAKPCNLVGDYDSSLESFFNMKVKTAASPQKLVNTYEINPLNTKRICFI